MTLLAKLSDDIRRAYIYETTDFFSVEQILPLGNFNFTSEYLFLPKGGFIPEAFDFKFFKKEIIELLEDLKDE